MMTTSHPIAALLVLVPKHSMSIPDDRTLQLVRKTKKVGTLTNLRACMDVTLAIVSARARYCDYECMQVRECEYCRCVRVVKQEPAPNFQQKKRHKAASGRMSRHSRGTNAENRIEGCGIGRAAMGCAVGMAIVWMTGAACRRQRKRLMNIAQEG